MLLDSIKFQELDEELLEYLLEHEKCSQLELQKLKLFHDILQELRMLRKHFCPDKVMLPQNVQVTVK